MEFKKNHKDMEEDSIILGLPSKEIIIVKYLKNKTSMKSIFNVVERNLNYYISLHLLGEEINDLSKTPEMYNISNMNKYIEVKDKYKDEKFNPNKYDEFFSLFVKSLEGKTITLKGNNNMTIFELKLQILEKYGTSIKHQRLIFAGRQLEDNRTISDYMLSKDSNLSLVYRLAGGMMNQVSGRNGSFDNLGVNIIRAYPDLE